MPEHVNRPIVYGGPSLHCMPSSMKGALDLRPPVKRGDLEDLRLRGNPGTVLLVDGVFGSSMAVTVMECAELLRHGWQVHGAASIGALRASELWSLGMVGIGEIYTMLRLGIIDSDAELAVIYDSELSKELTVSVVQLRAVLNVLALNSFPVTDTLLDVAKAIYFAERTWASVFRAWREIGADDHFLKAVQEVARDPWQHPKIRDADLACRCVLAQRWLMPLRRTTA